MTKDNNLTLALTRVGDLLLRDHITKDADGKPIENIYLQIPEYQRPYKWAVKNAIQLFDDINEARANNKRVYRVGTLILHKNKDYRKRSENEDDSHDLGYSYDIVDGQQRAITFALLLRALLDAQEADQKDSSKVDNAQREQQSKGAQNGIALLDQDMQISPTTAHAVATNFRALKRRCTNLDKSLNEYLEYVENNCEMVVVITEDISEAFQFFDSQNARGKKLYPHDLLKAFHLREMNDLDTKEIEDIVRTWEEMPQSELAFLFSEYLYRLKEWIKGNRATELNEHNIDMFKGVTSADIFPFAQYYKGAHAYANAINTSSLPFVTGLPHMSEFQIDSPIVAGKPFFEYAKHYFSVLKDIQNNDKYEGCFINDNEIVKTLDRPVYRTGTGNKITRLMFDTAILLYVDRFCLDVPTQGDLDLLDQFAELAFIWAYSMRAQYENVGWLVAQNYIMGVAGIKPKVNSFNIYKLIAESATPTQLLSSLSAQLEPLPRNIDLKTKKYDEIDHQDADGVYTNYLHFFVDKEYLNY